MRKKTAASPLVGTALLLVGFWGCQPAASAPEVKPAPPPPPPPVTAAAEATTPLRGAYGATAYDEEAGGLFQLAGVFVEQRHGDTTLVLTFATVHGAEAVPRHLIEKRGGGFDIHLIDTRAPRHPYNKVIEVGDGRLERIGFDYPDDATTVLRVSSSAGLGTSVRTAADPARLEITFKGPRG